MTFLQASLNPILPKVLISSYKKLISRHKKELQPQAKDVGFGRNQDCWDSQARLGFQSC